MKKFILIQLIIVIIINLSANNYRLLSETVKKLFFSKKLSC